MRNRGLWNEIGALLTQGDFKGAVQVTSRSDAAMGQILSYGLARIGSARSRDDIEKAMEESLMDVVPRLEKRTHYLATFANLATLLGLLGTVIGLINAFAAVATVNPAEKANLLSASISVAMNCTAFGLMTRCAAAADPRGSADQDHGADRQPRNGVGEIPQRRH